MGDLVGEWLVWGGIHSTVYETRGIKCDEKHCIGCCEYFPCIDVSNYGTSHSYCLAIGADIAIAHY